LRALRARKINPFRKTVRTNEKYEVLYEIYMGFVDIVIPEEARLSI